RSLERAAGDLTLAQFRVLSLVAGGDERSSLLAERLAGAKPNNTPVVDGLLERGLGARGAGAGGPRPTRLPASKPSAGALRAAEREMVSVLETVAAYADDGEALIAALCDLDDALTARTQARLRGEVRA